MGHFGEFQMGSFSAQRHLKETNYTPFSQILVTCFGQNTTAVHHCLFIHDKSQKSATKTVLSQSAQEESKSC